jgi:HlyD family secretion protein
MKSNGRAWVGSITVVVLLVSACRQQPEADASGNFEATEITLSAETDGIIQAFRAEEGQLLQKNELLGYIDTTQLYLNKEQLLASANATIKQQINVQSQLDVLQSEREKLDKEKNRFIKLVADGAATQQQLESIEDDIRILDKTHFGPGKDDQ